MVELEKVKSLFKNINVIIEKYKEKEKDKYEYLFFAYQVSNNTLKIISCMGDYIEPQFLSIDLKELLKIKSTESDKITFIFNNLNEIEVSFKDKHIEEIIINLSAALFNYNYNKKSIINSI